MYYLLIQCWSFKVFAIPDLSQHVKSSNAFFSKLRKWTYHICVLNPRYIVQLCVRYPFHSFFEKKLVDLCATLLKKYRPTATFDENHYSK